MALYRDAGQRRIAPPLVFGAGVLWHLLRRGRRYDVVHTASFPYFSLLAAARSRRRAHGFRLVVDWHELWSRGYWREYLGGVGGRVGWAVQALCLRVPQRAFCFARLTAERLRAEGVRGDGHRAGGRVRRPARGPRRRCRPSRVAVFAGRHIPEKRAPAARRRRSALARAQAAGAARRGSSATGPNAARVLAAIADARSRGRRRRARASSPTEEVEHDLARALCMVLPSSPRGVRARRRRGRGRRDAQRRRARRGQRRDRAGGGRRQRLRRATSAVARGPRGRDRRASTPPAATLRRSTADVVRPQRRAALASTASLDRVAASYATAAHAASRAVDQAAGVARERPPSKRSACSAGRSVVSK